MELVQNFTKITGTVITCTNFLALFLLLFSNFSSWIRMHSPGPAVQIPLV